MTPRIDLWSWFLMGGALFSGLLLVENSHAPHATGPCSLAQGEQLYADVADREPAERQDAARRFRGSLWSQDDDFHFKEMKHVKDYAKGHHVTVTSLLDALDEGMHEDWPVPSKHVPNPKVMPCRPRLIY